MRCKRTETLLLYNVRKMQRAFRKDASSMKALNASSAGVSASTGPNEHSSKIDARQIRIIINKACFIRINSTPSISSAIILAVFKLFPLPVKQQMIFRIAINNGE